MPRHLPLVSVGQILKDVQTEHGLVGAKESPHQVDLPDGVADEQNSRDEEEEGEARARCYPAQASAEDAFDAAETGLRLRLLFQSRHEARHGLSPQLVVRNGGLSGGLQQQGKPTRAHAPQEMRHPRHHRLPRKNDGHPLIVDDVADSMLLLLPYGHVVVREKKVGVGDPAEVFCIFLPRFCEFLRDPALNGFS